MDDTQILALSQPFQCTIKHIPLKRLFDILFSLAVLIFAAPVFFIIAILVIFPSKGKIVYAHRRIGRGGKTFRCYKFRTMYANADVRLKQLLAAHPELHEEWYKTFKLQKDPRVTPVGRFLRKTSLDELPQFLNVLKGDLSVVGPRPVIEEEMKKYMGAKAAKILSIRPGITGLWQVSGRNDICYNKRIQLDEHYVDNHSLLLDLKLIARTIPVMITKRGAY